MRGHGRHPRALRAGERSGLPDSERSCSRSFRRQNSDPEFAAELPAFVTEIRRIFAADEIREYLRHLEQTKFLAPPDIDLDPDDVDELDKWTKNLGQKTPSEAQKSSCVSAESSNCFKRRNSPSAQPDFRISLPILYKPSRPILDQHISRRNRGCAASPIDRPIFPHFSGAAMF